VHHPGAEHQVGATASSSGSAMGHLGILVPLAVVQEGRGWLANRARRIKASEPPSLTHSSACHGL